MASNDSQVSGVETVVLKGAGDYNGTNVSITRGMTHKDTAMFHLTNTDTDEDEFITRKRDGDTEYASIKMRGRPLAEWARVALEQAGYEVR